MQPVFLYSENREKFFLTFKNVSTQTYYNPDMFEAVSKYINYFASIVHRELNAIAPDRTITDLTQEFAVRTKLDDIVKESVGLIANIGEEIQRQS